MAAEPWPRYHSNIPPLSVGKLGLGHVWCLSHGIHFSHNGWSPNPNQFGSLSYQLAAPPCPREVQSVRHQTSQGPTTHSNRSSLARKPPNSRFTQPWQLAQGNLTWPVLCAFRSRHRIPLCVPTDFAPHRVLDIPFPDARLASVALRALRVDKELSPLVKRELSVAAAADTASLTPEHETLLRVRYCASTNRMLRVAVNSFLDSLALVLEVMAELDVDVIGKEKAA